MWFLPAPLQANAHTAETRKAYPAFLVSYALFARLLPHIFFAAAQESGTNTYAPPHCSRRIVTALADNIQSVDYVRGVLYALVVQTFGAIALTVLMLAPCPADFNALARLMDVLA